MSRFFNKGKSKKTLPLDSNSASDVSSHQKQCAKSNEELKFDGNALKAESTARRSLRKKFTLKSSSQSSSDNPAGNLYPKEVADAVKADVRKLKAAYKQLSVDQLEDLRDEMEDLQWHTNRIQEVLSQSRTSGDVDDDELQAELEALQAEADAADIDAYLNAAPSAPSHQPYYSEDVTGSDAPQKPRESKTTSDAIHGVLSTDSSNPHVLRDDSDEDLPRYFK